MRLLGLLLAILLPAQASPTAGNPACQPVADVPDHFQVAWVAPVGQRVRARTELEVVRVRDLREWIHENGADQPRLLQALGLIGRKTDSRRATGDWMVTLFDVQRDWLCRPMAGAPPGEKLAGVPACPDPTPDRAHRRGYTGCGYTLDTGASTRGLDVFRITWSAASTEGFCVMPMSRFLSGA